MKNGNKPASPSSLQTFMGMSKRELIAMHAMQAHLIAHKSDNKLLPNAKEVASEAVIYADALLKELERTAKE